MNRKATLTFLGDIWCDATQTEAYRTDDGYDFDKAFEKISGRLKQSDYVVANLETPVESGDFGGCPPPPDHYAPIEFAIALKKVGVDLVSTSNNHCLDKGIEGLVSTAKALDKIGMSYIGTRIEENDSYLIKEINGIKIGFVSFTYGTNAFLNNCYLSPEQFHMVDLLQNQELSNPFARWLYHSDNFLTKMCRKLNLFQMGEIVHERKERKSRHMAYLKQTIEKCKNAGAEIIIGCMHVGGQFYGAPMKYTTKICGKFVEMGIDIVIGNHEHVIHPYKTSVVNGKKKFVAYSLGDGFCDIGVLREPFDKNADCSVMLTLTVTKDNKEVSFDGMDFSIIKLCRYDDDRENIQIVLLDEEMQNPSISESRRDELKAKYEKSINAFVNLGM